MANGNGNAPRRNISQRSELIYDLHEHCVNPDTREIFLHGHMSDDPSEEPGVDYRMAVKFAKNIRFLTTLNKEPILIHMHTCGGDWCDGLGIYDVIKYCGVPTTIIGHAAIRSMSSIIFQAANRRVFMPNSVYLMHWGTFAFDGEGQSLAAEAKQYEKDHAHMLRIYCERAKHGEHFKGMPQAKIIKELDTDLRLKQEWYMYPSEAIFYGFGDGILGQKGFESVETLLKKPHSV